MSQEAKLESSIDLVLRRHAIVAASCASLGVMTDILSPAGGLYVSMTITAACVMLTLSIWLKRDWVIRKIEQSSFLRKALGDFLPCEGRCHETPLFQYAVIGALVFGSASWVTRANADDGGFLAAKFDQVSALQSMMGIMASVQEDVGQIRQDTTDIKKEMEGLDRETSDDPRKELAKRGHNWHPFDFFNAALTGNLEDVRLFRKAGMKHLGDATAPCEMFPQILLFGYAGQPEDRSAIWEEVLAATGNDVLTECETTTPLSGGMMQGMRARPKIQKELRKNWQYYEGVSEGHVYFDRYSMLMLAVWMNDAEMVKLFLAHGADPDRGLERIRYRDYLDVNITPLSEARRLGFTEIEKALEKHDAKDVRTDVNKLISES